MATDDEKFVESANLAMSVMDNPIALALTELSLEYMNGEYRQESNIIGELGIVFELGDPTANEIIHLIIRKVGHKKFGIE